MHVHFPLAMEASVFIPLLFAFLIWAAFAVINFWIWGKGKALGNLLMLIGGGCIALANFIMMVSTFPSPFITFWLPMFGSGLILYGFFCCSKPLIKAQLAAIKAKMDSMKDSSDDDAGKDAPAEERAKDSSSES